MDDIIVELFVLTITIILIGSVIGVMLSVLSSIGVTTFTLLKCLLYVAVPVGVVFGVKCFINYLDTDTLKKIKSGEEDIQEVECLSKELVSNTEKEKYILKVLRSWGSDLETSSELYTSVKSLYCIVDDIIKMGYYDDFLRQKCTYIDILISSYKKYVKITSLRSRSLRNTSKIYIQLDRILKSTVCEFKGYLDNLLEGDYMDASTDADVLESLDYQDYFGDLKKLGELR